MVGVDLAVVEPALEPAHAVALVGDLTEGVVVAPLLEALGGPADVVQLGRRSAYLYNAANKKSAGLILIVVNMFHQDSRADRVWVFFDEDDVLSHVGSTYETHQTQYALPWEDVHEAEDNEKRDREREGLGVSEE